MPRPRHRFSRTTTAILLAVLLTVGFTAATVAPAAATHDGGSDSGMADALSPTEDGTIRETVRGTISGLVARTSYFVSSFTGDAPTVEESRDDAVETFNQYNDSFVQYLNNRNVHNGEVIEVTFVQDGEKTTAYIVATYNSTSEEYESANAVTTTDRAVDHKIELRGMAADKADEELERFHDEFAADDRDITSRYASEMAAKYRGLIDEPFTGGD